MVELESRIVPLIVDSDTFWQRYFYHLHLLQAAHEARSKVILFLQPSCIIHNMLAGVNRRGHV